MSVQIKKNWNEIRSIAKRVKFHGNTGYTLACIRDTMTERPNFYAIFYVDFIHRCNSGNGEGHFRFQREMDVKRFVPFRMSNYLQLLFLSFFFFAFSPKSRV